MKKQTEPPYSGAGTSSGTEHSAETLPEDFDPAESRRFPAPFHFPID